MLHSNLFFFSFWYLDWLTDWPYPLHPFPLKPTYSPVVSTLCLHSPYNPPLPWSPLATTHEPPIRLTLPWHYHETAEDVVSSRNTSFTRIWDEQHLRGVIMPGLDELAVDRLLPFNIQNDHCTGNLPTNLKTSLPFIPRESRRPVNSLLD